tara:strand:+ start:158 stop:466 length:309 start_codon:yes stop_codon:yes gene_type:complete
MDKEIIELTTDLFTAKSLLVSAEDKITRLKKENARLKNQPKIKIDYKQYMKFHGLVDSMVVDMRTHLNGITDDELRKKLNNILQDYRTRIYQLNIEKFDKSA